MENCDDKKKLQRSNKKEKLFLDHQLFCGASLI